MHTQTTEAKTNVLDGYVTRQGFAKQIGKTVRTLDRWEALRIGPPLRPVRPPGSLPRRSSARMAQRSRAADPDAAPRRPAVIPFRR